LILVLLSKLPVYKDSRHSFNGVGFGGVAVMDLKTRMCTLTFFDPRVPYQRIKSGKIPKTGGDGKRISDTASCEYSPGISLALQAIPKGDGNLLKVDNLYSFKGTDSVPGIYEGSFLFTIDGGSDKRVSLPGEVDGDVADLVLPIQLSDISFALSEDLEGMSQEKTLTMKLGKVGLTSNLIAYALFEFPHTTSGGARSDKTLEAVVSIDVEGLDFGVFLKKETHRVQIFNIAPDGTDEGKLASPLACRHSVEGALFLTKLALLISTLLYRNCRAHERA
jgi:hypothetical protein